MIGIAFANASLRELFFVKSMTVLKAHQLSTIALIVFCSIYVWLVFPLLNVQSSKQALLIGLFWMILTITFEFLLGRLTNKSWSYLLENYNIVTGHIWILFLVCLLWLPYLFYVIRK